MKLPDEQIAKVLLRSPRATLTGQFTAGQIWAAEESLASLGPIPTSLLFLHDHRGLGFPQISVLSRLPAATVQALYRDALSSFIARLQQLSEYATATESGPESRNGSAPGYAAAQANQRAGESTTDSLRCPRCGVGVTPPPGWGYKFFVCLPCGARVRVIKRANESQGTAIRRVEGCGVGDQEVALDRRGCYRLLGVSTKTPLSMIEEIYRQKLRLCVTAASLRADSEGHKVTTILRRRLTSAWEQIQAVHPQKYK